MANSNKIQEQGWGGNWTEQKLDCFTNYVRAYLTIMNVRRDKCNWKLIYFDGFAGCGERTRQEIEEEKTKFGNLFGDDLTVSEEMNVYEGAAERVVKLEQEMRGFDFYYFVDKFEENCTQLELKLSQYNTRGLKQFRPGDANIIALQLAKTLRENSIYKSLCLLDPFGMNINWNTILELAGKGIDLWILVPSGVIVNRLLKNDGSLLHADSLVRFFGLSERVIKEYFYERKENLQLELFADTPDDIISKKANTIELIAQLYCEQLGTLFPYVTNKPLVLRNSKNVPIYHFVCASFNQTAVKIAQDIIRHRQ